MITRQLTIVSVALLLLPLTATAGIFGKDDPPDEQRAKIQTHAEEVLAELYEAKPETRDEIERAVGYAVFDSFGLKILIGGSEHGKGLAHDNESGQDTYMKMFSGGVGLGVGITKFKVVMVFHTRSRFDDFVSEGWDFSGEAEASATTGEKGGTAGGADSFSNVNVYQMTEKGLALEATLSGTKYWKDDDLN